MFSLEAVGSWIVLYWTLGLFCWYAFDEPSLPLLKNKNSEKKKEGGGSCWKNLWQRRPSFALIKSNVINQLGIIVIFSIFSNTVNYLDSHYYYYDDDEQQQQTSTLLPTDWINYLLWGVAVPVQQRKKNLYFLWNWDWFSSVVPSFLHPLFSFCLLLLFSDIIMYFNHRLFHKITFLYKKLHHQHHKGSAWSVGLGALQSSLGDLFFINMPAVLLPTLLFRDQDFFESLCCFWLFVTVIDTVLSHSSALQQKMRPLLAGRHSLHHAQQNVYYGTSLGLVDFLMGTHILLRYLTRNDINSGCQEGHPMLLGCLEPVRGMTNCRQEN